MKFLLAPLLLSTSMADHSAVPAGIDPECDTFHELFADGEQLCNAMFDNAFKYTIDDASAFAMWGFDANAANAALATSFFGEEKGTSQCELQYYHKGTSDGVAAIPTPEGPEFNECHPWVNNACCEYETVATDQTINEAYGEGYEWDRCGPMSQACERFWVQEGCFYECEPANGNYRLCSEDDITNGVVKSYGTNLAGEPLTADCSDYGGNRWQLFEMPIKASYCDEWYTACYNDYFLGSSYFEKADIWKQEQKAIAAEEARKALEEAEKEGKREVEPWAISLICIFGVVIVGCGYLGMRIRKKEMEGDFFFPVGEKAGEAQKDDMNTL